MRESNNLMPNGDRFPAKRKETAATIQRRGKKHGFVMLFVFVLMPDIWQHPCQQENSQKMRCFQSYAVQILTVYSEIDFPPRRRVRDKTL